MHRINPISYGCVKLTLIKAKGRSSWSQYCVVLRKIGTSLNHFARRDVFAAVMSEWARRRSKSPASRMFTQPFVQTRIKENIKAHSQCVKKHTLTHLLERSSWWQPWYSLETWKTSFPWASYQIRKIAGCACAGNAGNVFPRRRFQRKPLVSDPDMHHGTCVTHVPWCMSGSLTCGDGENVPGIPGACAPAILRIWQEAHVPSEY